ncbi:MAG TPA: hypothetical protein VFE40_10815 [Jatrophihabitantaceae bacterium]|nr:hypothetical protein [Jatrophihabitantaceae bacterium]
MTSVLRRRLPVLVLGVLSLLAGLWGGLLLLGLPLPTLRAATAADHGPLMALGFLGTVISLERAVALRRRWAFAAPAAAGAGGVALLTGLPAVLGWALLCLAAVVFVLVYAVVLTIDAAPHIIVMTAGAVCWYVATVLWFGGWTIPHLVPWLAGFLVFTILGERLELARVALLSPASLRAVTVGGVALASGLVLTAVSGRTAEVGIRLAGAALIALALWGARYDVARRTVRIAGVTRFMAVCLLAGYAWLLVAGATWLASGDIGRSVGTYDLALHAVFLGFVMSMIFGHAPVIVPAVLGTPLPFRPWFYGHLAVLHLALILRLVVGDAGGVRLAWQVGGAGAEVAILAFLAVSAVAVVRARRSRPRSTTRPSVVRAA